MSYGVGLSGGAEHIIHASHSTTAYISQRQAGLIACSDEERDDPTCLLVVDAHNAFNCLRRKDILSALRHWEPRLLRFYKWNYGDKASLHLGDGTRVGSSQTGVRQGCPLGCLFYTLGTYHVLEELRRACPTVEVMGYIDDLTLVGRRSHLEAALRILRQLLLEAGIRVNMSKTEMFDASWPEHGDQTTQDGLRVTRKGVIILGGPEGDSHLAAPMDTKGCYTSQAPPQSYAADYALRTLRAATRPLQQLRLLTPFAALAILRTCINTRPSYLIRNVLPSDMAPACLEFDAAVDEAIADIARVQGGVSRKSHSYYAAYPLVLEASQ